MGLNDKVSAERAHIGFFGLRNAGKSSVVNAVTGQKLSLVSDVKGTTTDPVQQAMEILPLGPVVIIDTPGLDDEGELGAMRVQRARQALRARLAARWRGPVPRPGRQPARGRIAAPAGRPGPARRRWPPPARTSGGRWRLRRRALGAVGVLNEKPAQRLQDVRQQLPHR